MFSSTVKLADLDDFLTPAQECVKPILDAAKKTKVENDSLTVRPNLIKSRRKRKEKGQPHASVTNTSSLTPVPTPPSEAPVKEEKVGEAAQVSLYDCLSCAGCVTTSEAILIQQQGNEEFLKGLKSHRISVVSVSPQSRTALALFFGMNSVTFTRKLCGFFKHLGATYVVDMSASDAITLLETRREFIERYSAHLREPGGRHLPLITSHCPGWVCYAEKVLEPELLAHMSRVMSSQQIQGRLVKTLLRKQHDARMALWRYRQTSLLSGILPNFRVRNDSRTLQKNIAQVRTLSDNTEDSTLDKSSETSETTASGDHSAKPEVSVKTDSGPAKQLDVVNSLDGDVRQDNPQLPKDGKSGWLHRLTLGYDIKPAHISDILHTCVMPCYDKKLEATRPDFRQHSDSLEFGSESIDAEYPDVDLVLATSEVLKLLNDSNVDIHSMPEVDLDELTLGLPLADVRKTRNIDTEGSKGDNFFRTGSASRILQGPPCDGKALIVPLSSNFGSGGFLEDTFKFSAETLFDSSLSDAPLELKVGRNNDYKDVVLKQSADVKLRFAMAYGFRNIQNVMRVIRTRVGGGPTSGRRAVTSVIGSDDYVPHFVEIMACPGGCLNGGGQILTPPSATSTDKTRNAPVDGTKKIGNESVPDSNDTTGNANGGGESGKVVNEADEIARAAADAVEKRDQEDTNQRQRRLDKLEELLHSRTMGNVVVLPEQQYAVLQIYDWLGQETSDFTRKNREDAAVTKRSVDNDCTPNLGHREYREVDNVGSKIKSSCSSVSTSSGLFRTTFRSLKEMQKTEGVLVPSVLKW